MIDQITIPLREYQALRQDRYKLWALEGAGVDNWEGFDDAMEAIESDEN